MLLLSTFENFKRIVLIKCTVYTSCGHYNDGKYTANSIKVVFQALTVNYEREGMMDCCLFRPKYSRNYLCSK